MINKGVDSWNDACMAWGYFRILNYDVRDLLFISIHYTNIRSNFKTKQFHLIEQFIDAFVKNNRNGMPYVILTDDWNEKEYFSKSYPDYIILYKWVDLIYLCRENTHHNQTNNQRYNIYKKKWELNININNGYCNLISVPVPQMYNISEHPWMLYDVNTHHWEVKSVHIDDYFPIVTKLKLLFY